MCFSVNIDGRSVFERLMKLLVFTSFSLSQERECEKTFIKIKGNGRVLRWALGVGGVLSPGPHEPRPPSSCSLPDCAIHKEQVPFFNCTQKDVFMRREERLYKQQDVTWQRCWLNTHLLLCAILPGVECTTSCMTKEYSHALDVNGEVILSTQGYFFNAYFIWSSKDCCRKQA